MENATWAMPIWEKRQSDLASERQNYMTIVDGGRWEIKCSYLSHRSFGMSQAKIGFILIALLKIRALKRKSAKL